MAVHKNKLYIKLFLLSVAVSILVLASIHTIPTRHVLGVMNSQDQKLSRWEYPVIWESALKYLQKPHLSHR